MFLVSIICFLAFNVIHGDIASYLGGVWASPEQAQELREELGLDRNVFVRFFDWLGGFLSGNPGNSLQFRGEAITLIIADRLPVSITLALLSVFFILLISVPVSLLTVKREGGIVDRIVNLLTAAGISTPGFFLGLLFIFFFGFTLKLFIPGNYVSYKDHFWPFFGYLVFPALAIAVPNAAILIKFLRGSLFSELHSDYVRTARSKGASRLYILRHHVFKNAIIPSITVLGMIIAEVLSGSIIIEQVFSIPGIGRLLIASISSRDYPLIQALMVYIAFLVVTVNTLADICIMIIDPRIKPKHREIS
jgi:ABC-type dipeptide/oligopeptide/nickel transport system permease component